MRTIPLTQGKVALVDDEDYGRISRHRWFALRQRRRWVAVRKGPRRAGIQPLIFMHREITKARQGVHVDHADHDALNNQRGNLRFCTPAQNQFNRRKGKGTSIFKGVWWDSRDRVWRAGIRFHRRLRSLGTFTSENLAATAYDEAARGLFGQFAALNFPQAGEQVAR